MDTENVSVKMEVEQPPSPEVVDLIRDGGTVCSSSVEVGISVKEEHDCSESSSLELERARHKISELESELAEEKQKAKTEEGEAFTVIHQLMEGSTNEKEKNKKLEILLAQQKTDRVAAEEKLKTFEQLAENAGFELNQIIQELQTHFQQCCQHQNGIGKEVGENFIKRLELVSAIYKSNQTENPISPKFELEKIKKSVEKLSKALGQDLIPEATALKTHNIQKQDIAPNSTSNCGDEKLSKNFEKDTTLSATVPVMTSDHRQDEPMSSLSTLNRRRRRVTDNGDKNNKEHKLTSKKNGFSCICGYVAGNKSNFYTHVRRATHEKKFQCGICKRKFVFRSSLREHRRKVHNIKQEKDTSVGCTECGKSFKDRIAFRNHCSLKHKSTLILCIKK